MSYERDEGARAVVFARETFLSPDDADERLRFARRADGHDESSADF
jgi:hypothetical protein